MNECIMFSNSQTKNNRLNNQDFNIDQNNCDYDFFLDRAGLRCSPLDDGVMV